MKLRRVIQRLQVTKPIETYLTTALMAAAFLAGVASCSKVNDETYNAQIAEDAAYIAALGIFEGIWSLETVTCNGSINVGDLSIDVDLPGDTIYNCLVRNVRKAASTNPSLKEEIIDSIGNIFFMPTYKVDLTKHSLLYTISGASKESAYAAFNAFKNSGFADDVCLEGTGSTETEDESTSITIRLPDPMTFSFKVQTDQTSYRIDLTSTKDLPTARYDFAIGQWILNYRFDAFNIVNYHKGRQYMLAVSKLNPNISTLQLQFYSIKKTGPATGKTNS